MNVSDVNNEVQRLIPSAKQGDIASIHKLWELVKPFMEGSACRYLAKFYHNREDVPGICYVAFEESLRRYDDARNFTFISFCLYIVKYHMVHYINSLTRVERMEVPFSSYLSSFEEDDRCDEERFIEWVCATRVGFEEDVDTRVSVERHILASGLSPLCVRVVELLMEGYVPCEIQRKLGIPRSTYYHVLGKIREVLMEADYR